MLNNNQKSCAFAEQMVSYFYDESAANEKIEFESHLGICPTCADELASFGFVRAAILDWRNEDFARLQTPAFDISAIESKKSLPPAINPSQSRSWFGAFGRIFALNPALSAALAVLVVCFGVVLFVFKFSGGDEIAGTEDNANLAQAAAAAPIVEAAAKPKTMNNADEDSRISLPTVVKSADSSRRAEREKHLAPIKSAVQVSGNFPKTDAGNSPRNLKNANDNIKKIAPVKKQPVPNLNDAEEDEDKTIRLADLFDEIDAR